MAVHVKIRHNMQQGNPHFFEPSGLLHTQGWNRGQDNPALRQRLVNLVIEEDFGYIFSSLPSIHRQLRLLFSFKIGGPQPRLAGHLPSALVDEARYRVRPRLCVFDKITHN
jgi:hypothetical protein